MLWVSIWTIGIRSDKWWWFSVGKHFHKCSGFLMSQLQGRWMKNLHVFDVHMCVYIWMQMCVVGIKQIGFFFLFKISLLQPMKLPWDVLHNDKNHNNYSFLNYSIRICTLLSLQQLHEGGRKEVKWCTQGYIADITELLKEKNPFWPCGQVTMDREVEC